MWQDPTNVKKRQPRRLRGTPAHKVVRLISFGVVGSFCSLLLWYTNSEAEWVQKRKERVLERTRPKESELLRREMFTDGALGSVITSLRQRQMDKEFADIDAGRK